MRHPERPAGRPASLLDRLWAIPSRGGSPAFVPGLGNRGRRARRHENRLAAEVSKLEDRLLLTALGDFLPDLGERLVSDDFADDFAAFDGSGHADSSFAESVQNEVHPGEEEEGGTRSFSVTYTLGHAVDAELTDDGWTFGESLSFAYSVVETFAADAGGAFVTVHEGSADWSFAAAGADAGHGESRAWTFGAAGEDDSETTGTVNFDPGEGLDSVVGTGTVAVIESFLDSNWWSHETGSLTYDAGGVTWVSDWVSGGDSDLVHETRSDWEYETQRVRAADLPHPDSEIDVEGDGWAESRVAAVDTSRSSGDLTGRSVRETDGDGNETFRAVSNAGTFSDTASGSATASGASELNHATTERRYETDGAGNAAEVLGGDWTDLFAWTSTPLYASSYASSSVGDFDAAGLGGTVDSSGSANRSGGSTWGSTLNYGGGGDGTGGGFSAGLGAGDGGGAGQVGGGDDSGGSAPPAQPESHDGQIVNAGSDTTFGWARSQGRTVFTEFGGFESTAAGASHAATGLTDATTTTLTVLHLQQTAPAEDERIGTEFANTRVDGFAETVVTGGSDATWSSRVTATDPAADGSFAGEIEGLSESSGTLTVASTAGEDLVHATGFGDWRTRYEEGADAADSYTVTTAADSDDDLTYVVDADGEATLAGVATAYATVGVTTGLVLTGRVRSTGRVRAGDQKQYVAETDYAADSSFRFDTTDDAGVASDAAFAADGAAVLRTTDTTAGGTTLAAQSTGSGGTVTTAAPAAEPPPGPEDAAPLEGGGTHETTYWKEEFGSHDVSRTGSSEYGSLGTLRVELPPPADGDGAGDPADPVVTYRHDAAGSFREGGSYAAEDRTRRLQTADYTFGDAFEIGTGRALHGGAQNDELLDRRTADGFDRSEGDWSDEAELTAAGDFAAESRSEGEAHAEDRTAREYLDRRVTRTDYAADADGRRPPAGGVHDSVTVAREDTVDATFDSVATLAWGSLYTAAAPAGGEPAAAGSDWFTETLTTDWDEAAEFEIGEGPRGRSAAGNTSDTRTVTTALTGGGGRTVRAVAGGHGSVESASHSVSLDVSDAGSWDYAHDLLFAVDPDGVGDLTGTERNRADGGRTETRRRVVPGVGDADDVLITEVLTHDFEHEATVTHLADDPGADGYVHGTETADREDAETHDRTHTRTRSDVPGETTVGAGDHGRGEVTALLAADGGIVEELWTIGAAREEGGPGWISLTGGDGGGDGDGDGGGGPEVRAEEALFEIEDALYTGDMHGGEVMRAGPYMGGPTESVRISAQTTTLGFTQDMRSTTRDLLDRGEAAETALLGDKLEDGTLYSDGSGKHVGQVPYGARKEGYVYRNILPPSTEDEDGNVVVVGGPLTFLLPFSDIKPYVGSDGLDTPPGGWDEYFRDYGYDLNGRRTIPANPGDDFDDHRGRRRAGLVQAGPTVVLFIVTMSEQAAIELGLAAVGGKGASLAVDAAGDIWVVFKRGGRMKLDAGAADKAAEIVGRGRLRQLHGEAYEKWPRKKLGGTEGFKRGGTQFDSELLDGTWTEFKGGIGHMLDEHGALTARGLQSLKDQFGRGNGIARQNGHEYKVFFGFEPPKELIDWLTKKGIPWEKAVPTPD